MVYINLLCYVDGNNIGPGPGRYALPTGVGYVKHDFSKKMNPAYSFGQKLSDLSKFMSLDKNCIIIINVITHIYSNWI